MRFDGSKLAIATAYLARENVEFVACNTDSTFPAIPGLKLPGAGRCVPLVHHLAAAYPALQPFGNCSCLALSCNCLFALLQHRGFGCDGHWNETHGD